VAGARTIMVGGNMGSKKTWWRDDANVGCAGRKRPKWGGHAGRKTMWVAVRGRHVGTLARFRGYDDVTSSPTPRPIVVQAMPLPPLSFSPAVGRR
jgi:hypothetical protein